MTPAPAAEQAWFDRMEEKYGSGPYPAAEPEPTDSDRWKRIAALNGRIAAEAQAQVQSLKLNDNDIYYLKTIARHLKELADALADTAAFSLQGEAFRDTREWLDCFIDKHERLARDLRPEPASTVEAGQRLIDPAELRSIIIQLKNRDRSPLEQTLYDLLRVVEREIERLSHDEPAPIVESEQKQLVEHLRKSARECEYDAIHCYAYNNILKDGTYTNPNAERSRQFALLHNKAADLIEALSQRSHDAERKTQEACAQYHDTIAEHYLKERRKAEERKSPGDARYFDDLRAIHITSAAAIRALPLSDSEAGK